MTDFRKYVVNAIILIAGMFACDFSFAKVGPKVVKVGTVEFPPYIVVEKDGRITGIVAELIDFMNSAQKDYKFQPVLTSAMRRHSDFANGLYDLSFFDDLNWGWDKSAVDVSKVYMKGKEVYIARAKPGRGESYFQSFKDKTMIGILGYHYAFANFNADPGYLRKEFKMQLSTSNAGSIKMVLDGRGDVAVVSDSFLHQYLVSHPDEKDKLLVSKKVDQYYLFTIIVRKNIRPTVKEINALLKQFEESRQYAELKVQYGIAR
ncbi:substrate-binding periplasmic protein [Bdellovibrio sp. HCB2-146]|uniref:substrate-binding periplasmic protein n=1 Tax=Bdellovibrio sp. HCB2-146 TaxID=3394362 RepID=UPI0039BD24B9